MLNFPLAQYLLVAEFVRIQLGHRHSEVWDFRYPTIGAGLRASH
jgi:hypothetical protein